MPKPSLTSERLRELLETLQARFESHPKRHPGMGWSQVLARLQAGADKIWSLSEMERTGGEPDAVALGPTPQELVYCDCSAESPSGRRSLCYDPASLASRKSFKPAGSALGLAAAMGVALLTVEQYRALQKLEPFDTKTSSWLHTPPKIRDLGGALFADRRFDTVFVYHNGAESYYAGRGFRGCLQF